MSTVLVAGGTGTLGREVVARLRERGHDPRVMSRHGGNSPSAQRAVEAGATDVIRGDLATGEGFEAALAGVDVLVHAATDPRRHRRIAVEGTRRLMDAARRAGVGHVLYISIVGVDAIPFAYYRSKLQAESLVEGSGVPWTVQRATQFHGLVAQVADWASRPPIVLVPAHVSVQPIDPGDVATRLVDLVDTGPSGRPSDIGGPEILTAHDAVLAFMRAAGREKRIVTVNLPGAMSRALRDGANLTPGHPDGSRTFDDYLAQEYTPHAAVIRR